MDTAWYYAQELQNLRELAVEFSRKYPSIAPLLSGSSSDPDVERLLEGTAYLTGQLTKKLHESYDHIAANLTAIVLPHLLRHIPSNTIIQFTPKTALQSPTPIPKGSRVASKDINNIPCIFSTAYTVDLAPLRLTNIQNRIHKGKASDIILHFTVTTPNPMDTVQKIRLHITGAPVIAAHKLYSLLFHTTNILITTDKGHINLPKTALQPVGFTLNEELFPYPPLAWEGYRLLQEYYVFPQKFNFFDIILPKGLVLQGNSTFTCTFALEPTLTKNFPTYTLEDFALFATPATNVFPFETRPIKLDCKQSHYPIQANVAHTGGRASNAKNMGNYTPYHVNKVSAVNTAGEEVEYVNLLHIPHSADTPAYALQYPDSTEERYTEKHAMQCLNIFPIYGKNILNKEYKVLSLDVLYTNGYLPTQLHTDHITVPQSTSPALATFTNIIPPTPPTPAPAEGNLLWTMLSHLHLNYVPLTNAESLKALLLTYVPRHSSSGTNTNSVDANKKRINAILSVTSTPTDSLYRGRPVRGINITITLDAKGFSNTGDMYLFGMIVAKFLHEYSAINSFMCVTVQDSSYERTFQWTKH